MKRSCIYTAPRGFTLIEMIVSVGLFMVVMIVAIGSLVSVTGADRKAQSIQAVVDNLNFALDDMSRTIRTGSAYHCTDSSTQGSDTYASSNDLGPGQIGQSLACPGNPNFGFTGSSYLAVKDSNGKENIFLYNATCASDGKTGAPFPGYAGGCIERSTDSGATFLPLTSPVIIIDDMRFRVVGAVGVAIQPRLILRIQAHTNPALGPRTNLNLQTTVTQRLYNQ